jgi:diadenylate cyclase
MIWLNTLQSFGVTGAIQILVLACLYYYIFLFFRGTRGAQVLVGLALLIFVLIGLTTLLHLDVLSWVLRRITVVLGIALLVIFQPEIRRALAELGKQPGAVLSSEKRTVIDHIVQAAMALAEHRIGGLIAIEREIGTRAIQETGTEIGAPVVPELLACIFYPHTPLHDGGIIISDNRIMAAGCVFPLSQNTELHKQVGTRHRAAVGISEETDAVVVVISEETGTVSVAYGGRLSRGLDAERLKRFLSALLRGKKGGSAWNRAKQQLDLTPEGIAKSERLVTQEKPGGE